MNRPEDRGCSRVQSGVESVISGKNIVCLASGWDYHPTSKHHIMRQLAERNHVVWVNWHSSRRPKIHWADLRAIGSKIGQIRKGARRVSDGITVITPWQVPIPGSRLVRRLNAASVRRAVRKVLSGLPDRPVQLWSFAPDVAELAGTLGEELAVYYCVDAFGEFPGYDRAMIAQRERELLRKCEVVLTTSAPLYEAKRELHPNVHRIQHGVDWRSLARAVNDELPVPTELADLPGPLIGYVGVIGQWVDLELVAGLAERRPDASIVMIGPELVSRGPCAGLPNVHWLGERDHATLPSYLRHFDVGLIPFKHVPLTHNANPIKLYEYLAAGVPVVSSPLPAVEAIPDSVWLADDADTLADSCEAALQRNDPGLRRQRSRLMIAESWEVRLEEIGRIISAALGEDELESPAIEGAVRSAELSPVA